MNMPKKKIYFDGNISWFERVIGYCICRSFLTDHSIIPPYSLLIIYLLFNLFYGLTVTNALFNVNLLPIVFS